VEGHDPVHVGQLPLAAQRAQRDLVGVRVADGKLGGPVSQPLQVGTQLYPGSLATATPQTFTVASPAGAVNQPAELTAHPTGGHALLTGPIRQISSRHTFTGRQALVRSRGTFWPR